MVLHRASLGMGMALVLLAAGLVRPVFGGDVLSWREVELVSARGVPNETVHKYAFRGVLLVVEEKRSKGFKLRKGGFYTKTSSRIKYAIWVEAVGEYDARGKKAEEKMEFEGDFEGQLSATFRMNEDPWLNHSVRGVVLDVSAATTAEEILPFGQLIREMRHPLTTYAVDPGRAAALSKQAAGRGGPPPPPPPPPPPKEKIKAVFTHLKATSEPLKVAPIVPRLTGVVRIEGESLVGQHAKATGGGVGRQAMQGFGKGWSGNAQLFWGAPGPGAELRLNVRHAAGGLQQLAVYLTKAPDFGQVRFFVQGRGGAKPVGGPVDGYAPRVIRGQRISLGNVMLQKGTTTLLIRVTGKNGRSTGHYFGLDLLELTPAATTMAVRPIRPPTVTYKPLPPGDMVRLNPQPEPPSAWQGTLTVDQFLELYALALRELEEENGVRLKVEVQPRKPLTAEQKRRLRDALKKVGAGK